MVEHGHPHGYWAPHQRRLEVELLAVPQAIREHRVIVALAGEVRQELIPAYRLVAPEFAFRVQREPLAVGDHLTDVAPPRVHPRLRARGHNLHAHERILLWGARVGDGVREPSRGKVDLQRAPDGVVHVADNAVAVGSLLLRNRAAVQGNVQRVWKLLKLVEHGKVLPVRVRDVVLPLAVVEKGLLERLARAVELHKHVVRALLPGLREHLLAVRKARVPLLVGELVPVALEDLLLVILLQVLVDVEEPELHLLRDVLVALVGQLVDVVDVVVAVVLIGHLGGGGFLRKWCARTSSKKRCAFVNSQSHARTHTRSYTRPHTNGRTHLQVAERLGVGKGNGSA